MFIGNYLDKRCVYSSKTIGLVDVTSEPQLRLTYNEMNTRANNLANWFNIKQIEKGDRIAVLAYDGLPFYDLFFACGKLGAILVPYNWRLHAVEIEKQIQLTKPRILFFSAEEPMITVVEHLRGCKDMPEFIPLSATKAKERSFEEIIKIESTESITCETLTEHDTACLLFTGGTTGQPKAAQISHAQIAWNTFNSILGDVLADKFLNIFPLFHAGGLFAFSIPVIMQGGTVIQTKKFDPEQVLHLIETEKVTIFGGVPTIFQMLTTAANWEKADLSSLRYCMSGGAPMPVPLIQKYQKEKGVVFRQGFGMTEFGPGVFSLASDDAERKAGSIGKPNFFVDAKVVTPENNTPLPSNQTGELVLRGPSAMTGYFDNPEATKAVFDDNNYFHTGDLAYVDDEGYFFIVDRLKDMYISGGENVYPAEIEAVLYKHPSVSMCAVVGIQDRKWGQVGCAFIVAKEGEAIEEQTILNYLNESLAKYKIPQKILFKDSLPISGAGKILKKQLRQQLI